MAKRQTIPYENATSGVAARDEITRILRAFGCESVGFRDEFDQNEVLLVFSHRGRECRLNASAKGWAALYLKAKPWSRERRTPRQEYERRALAQGFVAVNSILRDWVKGQVTAVECGMISFEEVFMPYMVLRDGQRVIDKLHEAKMLPPPKDEAA